MTDVHVGDGRTADLADFVHGDTIGTLAAGIAGEYLGLELPASAVFSLKVDGIVLDPNTTEDEEQLRDADSVELVDVTNYSWPDETEAVELAETGTIVGDDEDLEDDDDDLDR